MARRSGLKRVALFVAAIALTVVLCFGLIVGLSEWMKGMGFGVNAASVDAPPVGDLSERPEPT